MSGMRPTRQAMGARMANRAVQHDTVIFPSPAHQARTVRIAYYSHDTYGLGHLRRTLKVAGELGHRWPEAAQLIVTGSPAAQRFALPPATDYIKLPSVVKVGPDRYVSRSLAVDFEAIRDLRAGILAEALDRFSPDLFIVDHAPAGMGGEAVRALRMLRARSPMTRIVLGLRDIVDEPAVVRRAWTDGRVYELLDDVYDLILVYGEESMCDVAREYGLSPRAAEKVRYVGYLGGGGRSRRPDEVRSALRVRSERLVLVTAGGGGDGYPLLNTVADGLRSMGGALDFDCLAIGGPFMPEHQREQLRASFDGHDGVRYVDFVDDLPDHLAAADAVVAMGGYNTVCEVLDARRPALIVPRVEPRREQLIRAEALQRRGALWFLHPQQLSPQRLMAEIGRLLSSPPTGGVPRMTGLATMADELAAVLPPPLVYAEGSPG